MKIKIHYIKTKNSLAYIDVNILYPEKKLRLFKKRNRLSEKTISNIMQYKRWRARRGEHIIVEKLREISEEYDEKNNDVESEFEKRNIDLEE